MKNKGITLIALVVTVVVLLILAGISIRALNGENGIIGQAKGGKDSAEISEEKEIINVSAVQATDKDVSGNIKTEIFRDKLNNNAGEGKTEVIDNDETIVAKFIEKNRYYEIDKDGNVDGPKELINDKNAGDLSKDGKADGSEEKPFEINCIEDLVTFSIMVNGGNTELGIASDTFSGKNVVLMRTLDFKSIFSYNDYTTTFYGDLNTDGMVEDIRTELTKTDEGCIGFTPIGSFKGIFDGKSNKICNLYETGSEYLGLFGFSTGGTEEKPIVIKNLTITGNIVNAKNSSGGLIGRAYSAYVNIENVVNYVNVSCLEGDIGGLIGEGSYAKCVNINKCYNYGEIVNKSSGTPSHATGGLIGYTSCSVNNITNSANFGKIKGMDTHVYYGTGGIIGGGWNPTISIYNTCNYGEIIGNLRAGGIIGAFARDADEMAKLINVFNVGKVTSTAGWTPGGIVGTTREVAEDASTIKNCYYISSCTKGVANWSIEAGTQYTETQLKSEDFVNTLNSYIDSNTDGIDTSNWVKWKYNSNAYPTF